jgi:hypothetical protein
MGLFDPLQWAFSTPYNGPFRPPSKFFDII